MLLQKMELGILMDLSKESFKDALLNLIERKAQWPEIKIKSQELYKTK